MKAAVSVWDGRVSPVFDVSREAMILTIERGAVAGFRRESVEAPTPALKVARLMELGVDTLICGAISESLRLELCAQGVDVIAFVAGDAREVVGALIAGALPARDLSMPGCSNRRNEFRRGRASGGPRDRGWGARRRR